MSLAQNPLTAEQITELLSGTRTRGGYMSQINTHVNSGEIAMDFMALPEYSAKVPASVKNSVVLNLNKYKVTHPDGPELKCVQTKDNRVILVNVSAHRAALETLDTEGNED